MRPFLLLSCVLVVSCAPLDATKYRGPSGSEVDSKDAAACEMEGHKATGQPSGGIGGAIDRSNYYNTVYDACMRSKGYQKRT